MLFEFRWRVDTVVSPLHKSIGINFPYFIYDVIPSKQFNRVDILDYLGNCSGYNATKSLNITDVYHGKILIRYITRG